MVIRQIVMLKAMAKVAIPMHRLALLKAMAKVATLMGSKATAINNKALVAINNRLLAAMAHITSGDNLQLLAYGDHKIPLGNGESIVVGAALLRTCKAELFREHTAECEAAGKEPLDYKNYDAACSAAATGKTAMMGALDPVREQTRLNLERGRQHFHLRLQGVARPLRRRQPHLASSRAASRTHRDADCRSESGVRWRN